MTTRRSLYRRLLKFEDEAVSDLLEALVVGADPEMLQDLLENARSLAELRRHLAHGIRDEALNEAEA